VTLLSDGEQILGAGYASDVMLWKHLRPKQPPRNPFA
jgi:hypothetical protein